MSTVRVDAFGCWVRNTFAGWAMGFGFLLICIAISSVVGLGDTQFPVGLGMGLGVGLRQRVALRKHVAPLNGWWLGTAGAIAVPFVVTDVAKPLGLGIPYSLPYVVMAGGILAGVVQWRMLRPFFARAAWWIPASALGWSGAAATIVLNDRVMPKIPGIAGALVVIGVMLSGGVILGVVTGAVLQRLHRTHV